jgi:hypothetical protein
VIDAARDTAEFRGEEIPVAVTGTASRTAASEDCRSLWDFISGCECAIKDVPPERLLRVDPGPVRTGAVWAALLDDAAAFDVAFFHISRRMAAWMDPHQRVLLKLTWHALDATVVACSSRKAQAVRTYKGTRRFHLLAAWSADALECLAMMLGPGHAGSNTVAEYIAVPGDALSQIPRGYRRRPTTTATSHPSPRTERTNTAKRTPSPAGRTCNSRDDYGRRINAKPPRRPGAYACTQQPTGERRSHCHGQGTSLLKLYRLSH